MRIGLVTDVHNHAAELAGALAAFRTRGVDQVVTIGDTCDAFGRGDGAGEVASLLDGCSAVGVWGNHDFTLCRDVPEAVRDRYPPAESPSVISCACGPRSPISSVQYAAPTAPKDATNR